MAVWVASSKYGGYELLPLRKEMKMMSDSKEIDENKNKYNDGYKIY